MPDRTKACVVCGEQFPLTKTWRKYCSTQCARKGAPSAARVEVPCSICGQAMTQSARWVGKRDPICSMECQTEAKRIRQKGKTPAWVGRRSELPTDHPARWILGQWSTPLRYYHCTDCGALACYLASQLSAKRCRRCRLHQQDGRVHLYARFIAAVCSECSKPFVLDRLRMQSLRSTGRVFCSDLCSKRMNRAVRRARKKRAYVEAVSPAYVFKRDRYCCQICGKRLAMSKVRTLGGPRPHPRAPTIDHIIPLNAGGKHELSNVQAAHYICNSMKSDGAAADQLLLIG